MSTVARRPGLLLAALLVALVGLLVLPQPAATAGDDDCGFGATCGGGGGGGGGDGTDLQSSGNKTAQLTTPQSTCSVYANGGGMGMYCTGVGGDAKTLRERFGKQKLQVCRYSEIPPGIQAPFNANPGDGRYMLMSCLANIDFDTYNGGPDRAIDLSIVWVPNGTDVSDHDNGITRFLWDQFHSTAQLPVPFMRARPNVTPLVGIPTYFTFRWLDPASHDVVAQGPYAGRADGGPFKEITRRDVVMRAQATKVVVDPNQKGIGSATCAPSTPYREGASPKDQPADACSITFPRSSASARKYATKAIPSNVDDAFYADVTVTWQVTYGPEGGDLRELGDGFAMRMHQVIPVQEVQAPNQPPAVIY
jgi:hypothetical protein